MQYRLVATHLVISVVQTDTVQYMLGATHLVISVVQTDEVHARGYTPCDQRCAD